MAVRVDTVDLDSLEADPGVAADYDGRHEVRRGAICFREREDGEAGERAGDFGLAIFGQAESGQVFGGKRETVGRIDDMDGQSDEAERGLSDALEEDERVGIRALDGEEAGFGFEGGDTGGKVDDGVVRVVDEAEAGCGDLGHSQEEVPAGPVNSQETDVA